MMKKGCLFAILFGLFLFPAFSQAEEAGPSASILQAEQPVLVMPSPIAGFLKTELRTNLPDGALITKCRAWLDESGRLHILFPMSAPHFLEMHFTVDNSRFNTIFNRTDPQATRLQSAIVSQNLILERTSYAIGDVVYGFLDMLFSATDSRGENSRTFSVRGPFSALVRPKNFAPYADENILGYDPAEAVYELGDASVRFTGSLESDDMLYFYTDSAYSRKTLMPKRPAVDATDDDPPPEPAFSEEDLFIPPGLDARGAPLSETAKQLFPVRQNFFRQNPPEAGMVFREMVWNPAPQGKGKERLTIWFKQNGEEWRQIGYKKWTFQQLADDNARQGGPKSGK